MSVSRFRNPNSANFKLNLLTNLLNSSSLNSDIIVERRSVVDFTN